MGSQPCLRHLQTRTLELAVSSIFLETCTSWDIFSIVPARKNPTGIGENQQMGLTSGGKFLEIEHCSHLDVLI